VVDIDERAVGGVAEWNGAAIRGSAHGGAVSPGGRRRRDCRRSGSPSP
jgi:hypothetical protein